MFATFVFFVRKNEFAAFSAFSLALTEGLLNSNSLLMFSEILLAPKMCVAVRTDDSNAFQYTRRTRHAVATCLVANVCDFARTPLAARFTHVPFGHGCSQVPYDVIMSFHIVIQQVLPFGFFDPSLKYDVITI